MIYQNLSECNRIYQNVSEYIRMNQNISECIKIYQNLSEYFILDDFEKRSPTNNKQFLKV